MTGPAEGMGCMCRLERRTKGPAHSCGQASRAMEFEVNDSASNGSGDVSCGSKTTAVARRRLVIYTYLLAQSKEETSSS